LISTHKLRKYNYSVKLHDRLTKKKKITNEKKQKCQKKKEQCINEIAGNNCMFHKTCSVTKFTSKQFISKII